MRKIFLAFTLCFFIVSPKVIAQKLSHPHFISVNIGTNIPLSDYEEIDSLSSSGASNGIYYSFEAGAYFSRLVGFGVNIGAFNNPVQEDDIPTQVENDFTDENGKFSVSSENWNNGYIMAGPYLSFGGNKFIADIKLLAGVMNSEKPFFNVESNVDGSSAKISRVSNTAFGVNYGVHFRIKLVKKLALRLNAESLMSTQEFETKISETDSNGNNTQTTKTIEKEISVLNVGAGLVINL